jgi:MFS transporter, FSR family, fosmidomycin resistance protein
MTAPAVSLASRAVQIPVILVSLGHGATHWIAATFYLVLPFITRDLGLSYTQAGLLVTCFYVASAAANLPSGSVVDLTGRRVLIQAVALVGGAVGLFAVGLTESYLALAAAVTLIGATNMLWHPAAIAYLSGHLPKNRGYALSIHALGANVGDAVAPLVAGALMLSLTWHTTAELNALVGIVVAALIFLVLNGGDTAAKAEAAKKNVRSYLSETVAVFRRRAVWSLCLMAGMRSMMQGGLLVFLPLYLADELKLNPFWMGLALMLLQVGGIVASPIAGVLSDRIGRRPIVLAGMSSTTALVLALTLISDATVFVVAISILGFCMYAMRPVIHSWLMDRTPPSLAATMTSAMFGTQSTLTAITPAIGGMIADRYGLSAVFYFLGACILVANALALAVPRSEKGD